MNFKLNLPLYLSFSCWLCYYTPPAISQNVTIKEINIPAEIKSINALISNENNKVWLATGQGLYEFDGNKFNRYFDEKEAELYCINSILLDSTGNKWCGTYTGMLVYFVQNKISKSIDIKPYCKSDNYLITSISTGNGKNPNTEMLLTTSGGEIIGYDTITGNIRNIPGPTQGTIYAIQYGFSPIIWLCTSDGFYTMTKNSKWKKKSDIYTAYGLYMNNDKFWAIGRDSDKKAVLMLYYNENQEGEQEKFLWKKFDLKGLINQFTRFYKIGFTSDEMVWITCDDGLISYNPLTAGINEFRIDKKLESNAVQNIAVQNDNLIWISTSGKKLFRVDLK